MGFLTFFCQVGGKGQWNRSGKGENAVFFPNTCFLNNMIAQCRNLEYKEKYKEKYLKLFIDPSTNDNLISTLVYIPFLLCTHYMASFLTGLYLLLYFSLHCEHLPVLSASYLPREWSFLIISRHVHGKQREFVLPRELRSRLLRDGNSGN